MKLIVISPEAEDAREHAVLAQLFAASLTDYHLRKPLWSRDAVAAWLHALPEAFYGRIILHSHHDLAREFAVGGLHYREDLEPVCHLLSDKFGSSEVIDKKTETPICNLISDKFSGGAGGFLRSRAVHGLDELRASLGKEERLLVSPIFPSFSKPGYGPSGRFSETDLRAVLALPRRAEVIALGGIDASRIPACRELGFDGVAVLGAVWQSPDPVAAHHELVSALNLSPLAARL